MAQKKRIYRMLIQRIGDGGWTEEGNEYTQEARVRYLMVGYVLP